MRILVNLRERNLPGFSTVCIVFQTDEDNFHELKARSSVI